MTLICQKMQSSKEQETMAFTMGLWSVDGVQLVELPRVSLDTEKRLEDWIERDSGVLGLQLLFIGRQVRTLAGPIDLLALDGDANLVVLELKRDKTPREVVAQALDYASCIGDWADNDIFSTYALYDKKPLGKSLGQAFAEKFGAAMPEVSKRGHSIIIVASRLDDSSERIVNYLQQELAVNINAIFFNVFRNGDQELLARSWLTDPEQAVERVSEHTNAKRVPSGFMFVNVGESEHRDWIDCKKYGFVAAGYGSKFSNALSRLNIGDKVFAYMKGRGYVGYGTVLASPVMARDFFVESEGKNILDLPLHAKLGHDRDNPELADYVVQINWIKAFDKDQALTIPNVFANQNIVCRLPESPTADFLRREFEVS